MSKIPRISKAKLHSLKKLTQKKYRQEEGKFLLEGGTLLKDALNSDWVVESILMTEEYVQLAGVDNLLKISSDKKISLFEAIESELNELTDVVTSQGVISVISQSNFQVDSFRTKKTTSLIVALDQVNDPGNVGTIIRTCDWFGVDGILLSENSVELYNPKVVRSTMGSIFHLPIMANVKLIEVLGSLKNSGYSIVASTIDGGKPFFKFSFQGKYVVVLGNEAHGISPDVLSLADERITIPKVGKAESLNVAIACGVILAQAR